MDDLISRQAAIATAISGRVRTLSTTEDGEDWIRVSEVRESLMNVPSAQPTLYGYKIEHLAMIARVMQKKEVSPEKAVEIFQDIVGIVQMYEDEQKEIIRKAVEQDAEIH